MKVKVIQSFESVRGVIPAGEIIEISETLLEKLKGKVVVLPEEVDRKPDPRTLPHYCQPSGTWCGAKLTGSDYPTMCISISCEHYQQQENIK